MSDFPRTVDEITPEWLTKVLRDSEAITGGAVTSFDAAKIGGDQGIVGDVFRIELAYSILAAQAPRTVIVKFSHPDEARRNASSSVGMYKREVEFYRQISESSGLVCPTCFFADLDEQSGFMCLLVEDLGHLRVIDQSDDCSVTDAANALNQLSRMHARWWSHDSLGAHDWLGSAANPEAGAVVKKRYDDALESSLETISPWIPNGFEHVARRYGPALLQLREDQLLATPTLVHGDFRLGNLFFDDSENATAPVVAFDWQLVAAMSGATDVAYFVSWSLGTENRRRHEKDLLGDYYDRIIGSGVTGYSKTEFEDDLRRSLFKIVGTAIIATPNAGSMLATEAGRRRIIAMCERLQTVIDWNIEEMIPK